MVIKKIVSNSYSKEVNNLSQVYDLTVRSAYNSLLMSKLNKENIDLIVSVFNKTPIKSMNLKNDLNIKNNCFLFDMYLDDNNIFTATDNVSRIMKCNNAVKYALIVAINENSKINNYVTAMILENSTAQPYENYSDSPVQQCIC